MYQPKPDNLPEFVVTKFGRYGTQVAQVLRVTRNGRLVVRKWSNNGRRWTKEVNIDASDVSRGASADDVRKINR